MLKRLSDAFDDQLAYYLARIREIASLGDEAALIETDKLFYEFTQHYEEEYSPDASEDSGASGTALPNLFDGSGRNSYARQAMDRLQESINSGNVHFYEVLHAREAVTRARAGLNRLQTEPHDEKERQKQAEDDAFLSRALEAVFEQVLRGAEKDVIVSISSARYKFANIEQVVREYTSHYGEMSSDLANRVRGALERVARTRSDRLHAKADIAESSGREQSAKRMRVEAAAMLQQDWAEFFPDEDVPEVIEHH